MQDRLQTWSLGVQALAGRRASPTKGSISVVIANITSNILNPSMILRDSHAHKSIPFVLKKHMHMQEQAAEWRPRSSP
jgi:hypothetical protein